MSVKFDEKITRCLMKISVGIEHLADDLNEFEQELVRVQTEHDKEIQSLVENNQKLKAKLVEYAKKMKKEKKVTPETPA